MPPRPRHIPHNIERTALQKMSATYGLPLAKLHPAGEKTIAGMMAKGWVEKLVDDAGTKYYMTPAGEAAFKAKIPTDDFGR
jgi:hypothetical protein